MSYIRYIYRHFHYWLSDVLKAYSPIYINTLNVFILFKEYWKAREHFMFPRIIKMTYNKSYPQYMQAIGTDRWYRESIKNKLLYIEVLPLDWKDKFGDYVVEGIPTVRIMIPWLKKHIEYQLEAPTKSVRYTLVYWEAILQYIYGKWDYKNKKPVLPTINEVYNNNIWKRYGENNIENTIDILPVVNNVTYMKLMTSQPIPRKSK